MAIESRFMREMIFTSTVDGSGVVVEAEVFVGVVGLRVRTMGMMAGVSVVFRGRRLYGLEVVERVVDVVLWVVDVGRGVVDVVGFEVGVVGA